MLSAEFFDLDNGFTLFIPTDDYYTSDGKRLDQVGVTPNIKVKPAKAVDYVIKKIKKIISDMI